MKKVAQRSREQIFSNDYSVKNYSKKNKEGGPAFMPSKLNKIS